MIPQEVLAEAQRVANEHQSIIWVIRLDGEYKVLSPMVMSRYGSPKGCEHVAMLRPERQERDG